MHANPHMCVLQDLLYEYSVGVGDGPPRTLYKGTDFLYYFSLPSGDPNDDHKGKLIVTHLMIPIVVHKDALS